MSWDGAAAQGQGGASTVSIRVVCPPTKRPPGSNRRLGARHRAQGLPPWHLGCLICLGPSALSYDALAGGLPPAPPSFGRRPHVFCARVVVSKSPLALLQAGRFGATKKNGNFVTFRGREKSAYWQATIRHDYFHGSATHRTKPTEDGHGLVQQPSRIGTLWRNVGSGQFGHRSTIRS